MTRTGKVLDNWRDARRDSDGLPAVWDDMNDGDVVPGVRKATAPNPTQQVPRRRAANKQARKARRRSR